LIVIFNGPPGSGKDAAASYFKKLGFKHLSFKHVLFRETAREFDVSYNWFMDDYDNREVKERPEERLRGLSRREALIYTSEEVIKPRYGKDFFGVCVAKEVRDDVDYCISDGGFVEELVPLINRVGADNIILVQLTREGCDYSSDSRRYFNGNLVKEYVIGESTPIIKEHVLAHEFPIRTYRVHNNGSLTEFHHALKDIHTKECNEQAKAEARVLT